MLLQLTGLWKQPAVFVCVLASTFLPVMLTLSCTVRCRQPSCLLPAGCVPASLAAPTSHAAMFLSAAQAALSMRFTMALICWPGPSSCSWFLPVGQGKRQGGPCEDAEGRGQQPVQLCCNLTPRCDRRQLQGSPVQPPPDAMNAHTASLTRGQQAADGPLPLDRLHQLAGQQGGDVSGALEGLAGHVGVDGDAGLPDGH